MTDGIIQQIFFDLQKQITDKYNTKETYVILRMIQVKEQELIEKIKLIHPLHDSAFCSTCELKKWLIGDNQE